VDGGGGAQFWSYNNGSSAWEGSGAVSAFSFTGGITSLVTCALSRPTLGLTGNDTFYFDIYSSGGGGGDSAIDALANPNVSVTAWDQTYTSSTTGGGLVSYTIPEPSTSALLCLGALAGLGLIRRARRA